MKTVAFIYAKGTSTRLPGKNMKILGNKLLFCHAIDIGLKAKLVDEVVIDSDSDDILEIGEKWGAIPCKRPSKYATNETNVDDLFYRSALMYPDAEILVQLLPTSPFVEPESVDTAIDYLYRKCGAYDSVVGVYKRMLYIINEDGPAYFVNGRRPNTQDMKPITYETCGLYVVKSKYILETHQKINPKWCAYQYLSEIESLDINTQKDFEFAEIIWRGIRK